MFNVRWIFIGPIAVYMFFWPRARAGAEGKVPGQGCQCEWCQNKARRDHARTNKNSGYYGQGKKNWRHVAAAKKKSRAKEEEKKKLQKAYVMSAKKAKKERVEKVKQEKLDDQVRIASKWLQFRAGFMARDSGEMNVEEAWLEWSEY